MELVVNTYHQGWPEVRKASAFRTVWRRIYLHDEYVACSGGSDFVVV